MPEETYESILKRHGVSLSQEPTTQTASAPAVTEAAPPEAPAPTTQPQGAGGSAYEDILRRHGVSLVQEPAAAPVAAPAASPQEPAPTDFTKTLEDNRHLDFVDRVLRPEKYPSIQNEDGSVSTHRMASGEVDGKNIVYPTIIRDPETGDLKELPGREAAKYAIDTGQHITFPSREEAERFGSGGYKTAAEELRKKTSAAAPGDQRYSLAAQPEATPAPPVAPPEETQPSPMGGFLKPKGELPEALAPTAAQTGQPKSVWDSIFYVTQEGGAGQFNRAMAGLANPVLEVAHGLARGTEKTINFAIPLWKLNDNAPDWTWQNSPTGALTAATEYLKKSGAPELPRADEPITRWTTGLLGGLAAFMVGPKLLKLPHVPAAEIFGKGIPSIDRLMAAGTALATNLLNFGMVDVSTAISKGGGLGEARKALETSMQSAALFTLAGALPFSEVIKNPWLVKALESTATGGAFAGSAAIQGERDPWALAESFLTGFGLHALTSGGPMALQKYDAWQAKKQMREYFEQWRELNKVSEEEFWGQVVPIFDEVTRHQRSIYDRTPEVLAAYTPEQKKEMIFGGRSATLELAEPEAIRQLTAEIGGHEKAQRFYELYKAGDADTAMKEFPELSSAATEQQKAAEVKPIGPPREAGPLVPGAYSAAERRAAPEAKPESVFRPQEELPGALGKPSMVEEVPRDYRSLVNRVHEAGDPNTATQLNDIMGKNQETLNQLLGTPRKELGGMLNLVDRVETLWNRINDTGDPAAARELTDLIKVNEDRLRALPRLSAATTVINVARPAVPGAAAAESLGILPKEAPPVEKPVMPEAIVPTKDGPVEQVPLFPKETEAAPGAKDPNLDAMMGPKITPDGELEGYSVEQAAPVFYSQMAKSLDVVLPGKGDGPDLAKTIRRWTEQGGVKVKDKHYPMKAEELKWSGLEDWLVEQKGKVTKQQILDYLDTHQVEIRETFKGERFPVTAQQEAAIAAAKQKAEDAMNASEGYSYEADRVLEAGGMAPERRNKVINLLGAGPISGRDNNYDFALKEAKEAAPNFDWQELYIRFQASAKAVRESSRLKELVEPRSTKYESYKLHGGEDYRELLLTLPQMKSLVWHQWEAYKQQMAEKYGEDWHHLLLTPAERQKLESLHRMAGSGSGVLYQSGHWEEPNVLAHVRFTTRTDAQGRKTLFIEEVQSDWHQEARKKGYRMSGEQFNALQEQLMGLEMLLGQQEKDLEQANKDRTAVGRAAYRANQGMTEVQHDWVKKVSIKVNKSVAGDNVVTEVIGDVLGPFGVHKALGSSGFEITHIPSGYLIPRPVGFDGKLTKTRAKEIAEYFNAHALQDWNVEAKTVAENTVAYKADILAAVQGNPPEAKFHEMGPEHSAEASRLAQLQQDLKNEIQRTTQSVYDKRTEVSTASKGVADAPYGKTWHELTLKRMLRYAAENGFDQIGWINGEKTKERYDLSKQLDSLGYWTKTNELTGWKDGRRVVSKVVPPDKLGDYVGKEIAERLMSDEGIAKATVRYDEGQARVANQPHGEVGRAGSGRPWRVYLEDGKLEGAFTTEQDAQFRAEQVNKDAANNNRRLSGLQLQVGGEWANNLYDRMVPQFLSKYGKKWGAQVGEGQFDTATRARYQGPEYTVEQLEAMLPKGAERWTTGVNLEESEHAGREMHDVVDQNGRTRATLPAEEVGDYIRNEAALSSGTSESSQNLTPPLLRMISDMKKGMSFDEVINNEATPTAIALGGDFVRPMEKFGTIQVTPEMKESVLKEGQPSFAVETPGQEGLLPSEFKLTKEHLQEKVFRGTKVADLGGGRFAVETPTGSTFGFRETGYIEIDPAVYQKGYGQSLEGLSPGARALGKYTILGKDAFVALASGYKVGTVYHEAYHIAETLFLTTKEIESIRKQFPATESMSAEEAAAHGYEAWATNKNAAPNTIWQKIKDAFTQLLHIVRPTAESTFKQIQNGKVWERHAMEAKTISELSDGQLKLAGEGVGFGVNTFKEDLLNKPELVKALAEANGYPAADMVEKYFKDATNVYRQILAEPDLQFDWDKGSPFWSVKSNSDFYRWSEDFTTLCKNRAFMTATVDAIQVQIKGFLSIEDLLQVWTMLKAEGYPVECGPCYVSTARGRMGTTGMKFLEEWEKLQPGASQDKDPYWFTAKNVTNEQKKAGLKGPYPAIEYLNKHGKPDIPLEYFVTSAGNEKLAREYPEIYSAFAMKVFGGVRAKPIETSVEYRHEWLNDMVPDGSMRMTTFIEKVNRRGGIRSQSWSDFQMQHLLDKMQAIYDCAIRGAKRHSYTKVVDMVEAFGLTGEKINMSLVPGPGNGLTADGKDFTFADGVTTFPWVDARRLRNEFKDNAGTVMVGVSDEHIRFAMAHPEIDYIIPYHKSGRSQVMLAAYGMEGWKDYSYEQVWKDVTNPEKPRKMSIGAVADDKRIPCWDDYAYEGDRPRTPQEAVDKFFELCKKENLEPPFKRFAGEEGNYDPNYLKVITDTKWMHDGEILLKQRAVEPIFDQETLNRLMAKFTENPSKLTEDVPQDIVNKFMQGRKFAELEQRAEGLPEELAPTGLSVEDRNRRKEAKAAYPIGEVKRGRGAEKGVEFVEKTHLPEEIAPYAPEPVEKSFMAKYLPGYDFAADVRQGALLKVGPTAKSPEHFHAGVTLGSHLGAMHRAVEVTYNKLKEDSKQFDKMGVFRSDIPLEENPGMQFMSAVSTGSRLPESMAHLQPVVDRIRGAFYDRVQRLEQVDAPLDRLREFYFPGMWKKESIRAFNLAMEEAINAGRGGEAREGGLGGQVVDVNDWSSADRAWVKARTKDLLAAGEGSDKSHLAFLTRRPFKGTESFRKAKVFDDIMTGVEFGLEPISTNPIDLVKLKLSELDRSIMANGAIQEWKKAGDVAFLHTSKPVPEGWQPIEDKYGTVYGKYDPTTGTRPIVGRYIAKTPVHDVLKNYLSSSIYNSPAWGRAFKNYMFVGNLLNEVQLGVFSAFHAGFTSVETQITAGANLVKDGYGLLNGTRTAADFVKALKRYPTAMFTTAMDGGKILSEFNSPSGIDTPTDVAAKFLQTRGENGIALVAKAAELAGGGFAMDRGLRTYQTESMVRDWNSGKKLKALARGPMALIEVSMKPVLEWLVPRQKAGVFGEMVGRIVEMNPDKTLADLRPEFREAWNRVDARLGQVRYDRLFLDNAYKNAIQAIIRAPGWTGGTLTEVGGAPVDAAKFVSEWLKTGKAPTDIPNRVAYTMSLFATVCLANGLMTYLFTGETPKGMDFFAFRSGGKDVHGNYNRWLLPTYMKDIFAYFRDPLHTITAKTHPLMALVGDMMKNKTYYGEQITNEDRNWYQRWVEDRGFHAVKTFAPFWMVGANKAVQRAGGWGQPVGDILERGMPPLVGVMPAPRPYTASDAQKVIDKYNELTRPATTTKETVQAKDIKRRLLEMAREQDEAGFQELATEAIGTGAVTLKSVKDLMKESQNPPGLSRFTKLPLEWALKAFDAADESEQMAWKPYLLKKIQGGKPEVIFKHQEKVLSALEKLGLTKAAQAVKNLTVSEKYSQLDTTGLGVEKESPQMDSMESIDDAIAEALEKMTGEKPEKKKGVLPRSMLSPKKKKSPYEALGL